MYTSVLRFASSSPDPGQRVIPPPNSPPPDLVQTNDRREIPPGLSLLMTIQSVHPLAQASPQTIMIHDIPTPADGAHFLSPFPLLCDLATRAVDELIRVAFTMVAKSQRIVPFLGPGTPCFVDVWTAIHPTSTPFQHRTLTYDHIHERAWDPVRSPLIKFVRAESVLRSVTTGESSVLYVFFGFVFCGRCPTSGALHLSGSRPTTAFSSTSPITQGRIPSQFCPSCLFPTICSHGSTPL